MDPTQNNFMDLPNLRRVVEVLEAAENLKNIELTAQNNFMDLSNLRRVLEVLETAETAANLKKKNIELEEQVIKLSQQNADLIEKVKDLSERATSLETLETAETVADLKKKNIELEEQITKLRQQNMAQYEQNIKLGHLIKDLQEKVKDPPEPASSVGTQVIEYCRKLHENILPNFCCELDKYANSFPWPSNNAEKCRAITYVRFSDDLCASTERGFRTAAKLIDLGMEINEESISKLILEILAKLPTKPELQTEGLTIISTLIQQFFHKKETKGPEFYEDLLGKFFIQMIKEKDSGRIRELLASGFYN